LKHASEYYAELFRPGEEHDIHLDNSLWADLEQVTELDDSLLCAPFSEEVKEAHFQMEKNKAAGPDKIPIEFYQTCWGFIKDDVMQLFHDFHEGNADISRLNYGIITLLPKVHDASKIQQFRPI